MVKRRFFLLPGLWCAASIGVYALFLQAYQPKISVAPSQWSMNRIKAERYVVSRKAPALVVVGSSLSFRLPEEALGPDVANLAFGGVGPLTGLEVVLRSPRMPGTVVIEINFVLGDVDQDLLDGVFAPWLADLRAVAPVFRYEYQPVHVAFHAMRMLSGRAGQSDAGASPDVLERMLPVHRRDLDQVPPPQALRQSMARLEALASALEAQGVKIVLLTMPVHADLAGLAVPRTARELLSSRFPRSRYQWIEPSGAFTTGDGLHLVPADAAAVARQIRAALAGGN